jgi:hypothetical protein
VKRRRLPGRAFAAQVVPKHHRKENTRNRSATRVEASEL